MSISPLAQEAVVRSQKRSQEKRYEQLMQDIESLNERDIPLSLPAPRAKPAPLVVQKDTIESMDTEEKK